MHLCLDRRSRGQLETRWLAVENEIGTRERRDYTARKICPCPAMTRPRPRAGVTKRRKSQEAFFFVLPEMAFIFFMVGLSGKAAK